MPRSDALREFRDFILRGNVVDLAVAVVIGVAFNAVVQSIVSGLLTPLISAILGKTTFAALSFTIRGSTFAYGIVLNAIISFLLIAAVVFFLVVRPVNRLLARLRTEPPVGAATRACPECLSQVPSAATRCAFCTTSLEPA